MLVGGAHNELKITPRKMPKHILKSEMISNPAKVISSGTGSDGCFTFISNLLVPRNPGSQADVKHSIALGCIFSSVSISR